MKLYDAGYGQYRGIVAADSEAEAIVKISTKLNMRTLPFEAVELIIEDYVPDVVPCLECAIKDARIAELEKKDVKPLAKPTQHIIGQAKKIQGSSRKR